MNETQPRQATAPGSTSTHQQDAEISALVARLASDSWAERRAAEDGLRNLGTEAVPALINSLSSHSDQVRWGAAKVLGEIVDPSAIPALVEALEDVDGGVRWLAAQALVAVGPSALVPVLRQLLIKGGSSWVQEGAHHVLRSLERPAVSPVVRALEDSFPALAVPVAASEALKALESGSDFANRRSTSRSVWS